MLSRRLLQRCVTGGELPLDLFRLASENIRRLREKDYHIGTEDFFRILMICGPKEVKFDPLRYLEMETERRWLEATPNELEWILMQVRRHEGRFYMWAEGAARELEEWGDNVQYMNATSKKKGWTMKKAKIAFRTMQRLKEYKEK